MDSQAIRDQLVASGVSQEVAATFTDEQLQALVQMAQAQAGAGTEGGEVDSMADMPRDELIAALADAGEDPAQLEAMEDGELQDLYDALMEEEGEGEPAPAGVEGMADGEAPMSHEELVTAVAQTTGASPEELTAMTDEELMAMLDSAGTATPAAAPSMTASEGRFRANGQQRSQRPQQGGNRRQPSQVTIKYSERMNKAEQRLKNIERMVRIREAAAKKQTIEVFAEQMVQEGRLLPAQKRGVVARLLRADSLNPVVRSFSEKANRFVAKTELDAQMDEIRRSPVVMHFGERMAGEVVNSDDEINKVETFAEQYSGTLAKAGITKKQFVETFKKAREKNPNYTAAKHCGTAR